MVSFLIREIIELTHSWMWMSSFGSMSSKRNQPETRLGQFSPGSYILLKLQQTKSGYYNEKYWKDKLNKQMIPPPLINLVNNSLKILGNRPQKALTRSFTSQVYYKTTLYLCNSAKRSQRISVTSFNWPKLAVCLHFSFIPTILSKASRYLYIDLIPRHMPKNRSVNY